LVAGSNPARPIQANLFLLEQISFSLVGDCGEFRKRVNSYLMARLAKIQEKEKELISGNYGEKGKNN
jgi:hypothetical protein